MNRNIVEDRQSRLAWQTVNEVIGKKSTSRVKLKAASQEERLQKRKEHFNNQSENAPEIIDKPGENIFKANSTSK